MIDPIKKTSESEKLALELLAQANIPLSLLPTAQKLFPDSGSVHKVNPSEKSSSHPRIEKPEAIDPQSHTKGMGDLRNFLDNTRSIEELLNEVLFHHLAEAPENYAQVQFTLLKKDREYARKQQEELQNASKSFQENSMKAESWGSATKAISSISLVLTGGITLATAASPVGLGALIVGIALLADQLVDNTVKKNVASWIARGQKESEQAWLYRMEFFCTIASTLLSYGLVQTAAFQIALNVSTTAFNATKSVAERRAMTSRALREELSATSRFAQKNIDKAMDALNDAYELTRHLQQMNHQIDEGRMRLAHTLLRPNFT